MKTKIVIVGTGPFAEVSACYFEEYTNSQIVSFACHRAYIKEKSLNDIPVCAVEDLPQKFNCDEVKLFIAIGYQRMNKTREEVYKELKNIGYSFVNFVHPLVKIWPSTTLGENIFIFEDNTIQPFTSIGDNTIIWSGNHIGHHSSLGSHTFVASHSVISGNCKIGNNVFIGVNATIYDSVEILDETLISAGAIISKSTKYQSVYAASPTKVFPKTSDKMRL